MNVLPRPTLIALQALALLLAFGLGAWWFSTPSAGPVTVQANETVWTCSMHPQIRKAEPGACPLCGMDLIRATTAITPADPDTIVLSERARTLMKLRTAPVQRQLDASAVVPLLGRIEPAESTRRNVTTWIGGRIDRLHVNSTGEPVRKGQIIATLYSPEVYGAHQDLLTAAQQVARLQGSPPAAQQAARDALDAAQQRLRLLGVPDDTLATMAKADTPTRSVDIRSPFAGTVIERVATEGAYVQTGAPLYRVADLGTLWVQLDAYESDLARLAVGQSVDLTVDALPGETFQGVVDFIDPTLDPQRRTAQVRVVVDNPDGRLRPGLFAQARVQASRPDGTDAPLVIPASAPLFTGQRSVVYVEVPSDTGVAYAPRTVRLGPRLGDSYPVVAGLSEGEHVVSHGAFALDADLQIRGGPSMMSATGTEIDPALAPVPLSDAERARLSPVLIAYLDVQSNLADDDHAAAVAAATRLHEAVAAVTLTEAAAHAWAPLAAALDTHARHVAASTDLPGARAGFEPLSQAVEGVLRRFGNPLGQPVHVAFCPMAMGSAGARWVQQGQAIDNSYFGASMLTCGDIVATVAPGATLPGAPSAPRQPAHQGHAH